MINLKNTNRHNLQIIRNKKVNRKTNKNIFFDLLLEFEKLNVNIKKLPMSTPIDIKVRELLVNIANQILLDEDIITQIHNDNIFPVDLIAKYIHINKQFIIENKNYLLALIAIYKINCEPLINIIDFESKVSNYNFNGIIIEKGVNNNLLFSTTAEFLVVHKKQNLELGDSFKGIKSYSKALLRKAVAIISIFVVFFLALFVMYFNSSNMVIEVTCYRPVTIRANPLYRAIGFNTGYKYTYYKKNIHIYGKNIDNAIIDVVKTSLEEPRDQSLDENGKPKEEKVDFTTDGIIYIKISDIENISKFSKLEKYMEENNLKYQLIYNGQLFEVDK